MVCLFLRCREGHFLMELFGTCVDSTTHCSEPIRTIYMIRLPTQQKKMYRIRIASSLKCLKIGKAYMPWYTRCITLCTAFAWSRPVLLQSIARVVIKGRIILTDKTDEVLGNYVHARVWGNHTFFCMHARVGQVWAEGDRGSFLKLHDGGQCGFKIFSWTVQAAIASDRCEILWWQPTWTLVSGHATGLLMITVIILRLKEWFVAKA